MNLNAYNWKNTNEALLPSIFENTGAIIQQNQT